MTGDRLQVYLARPTEERQDSALPSLETITERGEEKHSGLLTVTIWPHEL